MARYPINLAPGLASFAATPLARVLGILGRRWSVLTLEALNNGYGRFNELQRQLDGITHKVLIDTLRSLQRDGFVEGPLTGAGAEYRLTALGVDFVELVGVVRDWGEARWDALAKARREFDVRGVA